MKWWEPLLWEGSSCLVATIWILLQRRVAYRWDDYLDQPLKWFGKHLAWLPVIAVTFITFIYAVRHGVYALTGETYEHASWPYTFFYETIKLVLFTGLWLASSSAWRASRCWQQERERLLELQKQLAESQLAQLKAQLQPHFLFNALNTISALMQSTWSARTACSRGSRTCCARACKWARSSMTSLREELKLLELYASIMQERFAGRVTLDWNIADEALDAAVPAMLLQPLLENAYKHGVERSSEPVAIRVEAQRKGDELQVEIRNTGAAGHAPGSPGSACAIAVSGSHSSTATARQTHAGVRCGWRGRVGDASLRKAPRMIRVLIVDDEAPARDKLRRWLGDASRRRDRGEAADGLRRGVRDRQPEARRGVPRHPDAGAVRPRSGGATRSRCARRCWCS